MSANIGRHWLYYAYFLPSDAPSFAGRATSRIDRSLRLARDAAMPYRLSYAALYAAFAFATISCCRQILFALRPLRYFRACRLPAAASRRPPATTCCLTLLPPPCLMMPVMMLIEIPNNVRLEALAAIVLDDPR